MNMFTIFLSIIGFVLIVTMIGGFVVEVSTKLNWLLEKMRPYMKPLMIICGMAFIALLSFSSLIGTALYIVDATKDNKEFHQFMASSPMDHIQILNPTPIERISKAKKCILKGECN